jgi:threonine dehydratase
MVFTKQLFSKTMAIIRNTPIICNTPLEHSSRLSSKYNANIFLKREDLQSVRSFKIRGAYNKIYSAYLDNISNISITTCSAGNHAQGVAKTCNHLQIEHVIFVPISTPKQKIDRIKYFGGDYLTLHVIGDTLKEALELSIIHSKTISSIFVHPYNDIDVILGQSTVAQEIYENIEPDYIIVPVGGGGLISGVGSYSKMFNPKCEIIGVEPENANSMQLSLHNRLATKVIHLDTFVDGASVEIVGDKCFAISESLIDKMVSINNGHLCADIIELYQNDGIITEPAGALGISALEYIKDEIANKTVVCILTGGNNDLTRYPNMVERANQYNGVKHYFLIDFNQISGQLVHFAQSVLIEGVDITRFEYFKKDNIDTGTVLVGIELDSPEQLCVILGNMEKFKYNYTKIHPGDLLHSYLI